MLLEQKIPSASSPDIRTIHGSISWEKRPQRIPSFAPRCRTAPSDALNRTQRAKWCWLFKATNVCKPKNPQNETTQKVHLCYNIHKIRINDIYNYICVSSEIFLSRLHKRSSIRRWQATTKKRGRQRSCWVVGGPIIFVLNMFVPQPWNHSEAGITCFFCWAFFFFGFTWQQNRAMKIETTWDPIS